MHFTTLEVIYKHEVLIKDICITGYYHSPFKEGRGVKELTSCNTSYRRPYTSMGKEVTCD